MKILVLNAGSSSVKYQLFNMTNNAVLASGIIEQIEELKKSDLRQKLLKRLVLIFSLKDLSNTMLLLIQLLLKPNYLTVK